MTDCALNARALKSSISPPSSLCERRHKYIPTNRSVANPANPAAMPPTTAPVLTVPVEPVEDGLAAAPVTVTEGIGVYVGSYDVVGTSVVVSTGGVDIVGVDTTEVVGSVLELEDERELEEDDEDDEDDDE